MGDLVIKVATQNSKGEKSQRIDVDDISTYRPWKNDDADEGRDMTFVVLKSSGKNFVLDFPCEKLDELKKVIEL